MHLRINNKKDVNYFLTKTSENIFFLITYISRFKIKNIKIKLKKKSMFYILLLLNNNNS